MHAWLSITFILLFFTFYKLWEMSNRLDALEAIIAKLTGAKKAVQQQGRAKRSAPSSVRVESGPGIFQQIAMWWGQLRQSPQFGLVIIVGVGAIALALAGVYLVKYSIEQGYLSPALRVGLAAFAGGGMVGLGEAIFKRANIVSEGLVAAGIAVLYGALYAAHQLYHFVPYQIAIGLMVGLTIVAVLLSIRHGPIVAFIGLLGGFAMPWLMVGLQPNAVVLFGYLFCLLLGLLVVQQQHGWGWLLPLATAASLIWAAVWLGMGIYDGSDQVIYWYVIGVVALQFLLIEERHYYIGEFDIDLVGAVRWATTIVGLVLLSFNAEVGGYTLSDWVYWAVISIGGFCIARLRLRYEPFAWFMMLATLLNIVLAVDPVFMSLLPGYKDNMVLFVCFGLSFTVIAYLLHFPWRLPEHRPVMWLWVSFGSALSYFVMAYLWDQDISFTNAQWGYMAALIAGLFGAFTYLKQVQYSGAHGVFRLLGLNEKNTLQASAERSVVALGMIIFLAFTCLLSLQREWVAIGLFSLVIVSVSLEYWLDAFTLRTATVLIAIVGALAIAVNVFLQATEIETLYLENYKNIPLLNNLWVDVFLPAILGLFAAWLRMWFYQSTGRVSKFLSYLSLAIIAMFVFAQAVLHIDLGHKVWNHQMVILSLLAYGVLLVAIGLRYQWVSVKNSGLAYAGFATLYVALLLVFNNPYFIPMSVGEKPFFNLILLSYGVAFVLFCLLRTLIKRLDYDTGKQILFGLSFVTAFLFATLQMRHLFWGEYIHDGFGFKLPELYGYSALWGVMSLAAIAWGVFKDVHLMRQFGMGLLTLTTAKVFLVDMSELTGLWRVVSLFGLGGSLIGLGYVYQRLILQR